MAYATADDLATALRIKATDANRSTLEACLEAAANEIDADVDRVDPMPDPVPALVARTNVARAVEWWKAADAAYGIVGIEDVGQLRVPRDGFARHAATLTPYKQQWGLA